MRTPTCTATSMFLTILLAGAMAVVGCAHPGAARRIPVSIPQGQSFAPLAVDVEHVRGSVRVEVDPKLAAPEVSVVGIDGESRRGRELEEFVAVELAMGSTGSVLRVASAPKAGGEMPRTLLTVRVPECAGLRVRTTDGDVVASGVSGVIDIEVRRDVRGGSITVVTGREITGPSSLVTAGGFVDLELSPASSLDITAESSGGRVLVQADASSARSTVVRTDRWAGRLGSEEGSIMTIRADGGDVRVGVARVPR
jgi:hypothetical protein